MQRLKTISFTRLLISFGISHKNMLSVFHIFFLAVKYGNAVKCCWRSHDQRNGMGTPECWTYQLQEFNVARSCSVIAREAGTGPL